MKNKTLKKYGKAALSVQRLSNAYLKAYREAARVLGQTTIAASLGKTSKKTIINTIIVAGTFANKGGT